LHSYEVEVADVIRSKVNYTSANSGRRHHYVYWSSGWPVVRPLTPI